MRELPEEENGEEHPGFGRETAVRGGAGGDQTCSKGGVKEGPPVYAAAQAEVIAYACTHENEPGYARLGQLYVVPQHEPSSTITRRTRNLRSCSLLARPLPACPWCR